MTRERIKKLARALNPLMPATMGSTLRKVFKRLENVEEAFRKLLQAVPPKPPEPEELSPYEALGYYLAEAVISQINIPPFP